MTIPQSDKYALGQRILGDDFISPGYNVTKCGFRYNIAHRTAVDKSFPRAKDLEWCQKHKLIVMTGPPEPMSVLDLLELEDSRRDPQSLWYTHFKFAYKDKVSPGWFAYFKEPRANSFGMTQIEQEELRQYLNRGQKYPIVRANAAELLWCLLVYKKVRNIYLLPDCSVRTSSKLPSGGCMSFGYYSSDGMRAVEYSDDDYYPHLGSLYVQKF